MNLNPSRVAFAFVVAVLVSACGGASSLDDNPHNSGESGAPTNGDPNAPGGAQGGSSAAPAALEIPAPPSMSAQSFNELPVGSSRNDLWLHSNTKDEQFFWHWDGKVWSKVPLSFRLFHAVDLIAASPGVVWIAGDSCGGARRLDADGHVSFVSNGKTECRGGTILLDGAEAATAVMFDEEGKPYRLQGDTFAPMSTLEDVANELAYVGKLRVVTDRDVWAWSKASNGSLWRFDGTNFQRVAGVGSISSRPAIFANVFWDLKDLASLSPGWAHRGPPVNETSIKAWSVIRIPSGGGGANAKVETISIPVPSDIPLDGAASYTGLSIAAARNGNLALLGCVHSPTTEERNAYVPDLMAPMPGYLVVHEWDGAKLLPRSALPKNIACPARDRSDRTVAEPLPRPLLDGTWIFRTSEKYVLIDP